MCSFSGLPCVNAEWTRHRALSSTEPWSTSTKTSLSRSTAWYILLRLHNTTASPEPTSYPSVQAASSRSPFGAPPHLQQSNLSCAIAHQHLLHLQIGQYADNQTTVDLTASCSLCDIVGLQAVLSPWSRILRGTNVLRVLLLSYAACSNSASDGGSSLPQMLRHLGQTDFASRWVCVLETSSSRRCRRRVFAQSQVYGTWIRRSYTLVSLWLQVSSLFTYIPISILMTYRLGRIFGEYP